MAILAFAASIVALNAPPPRSLAKAEAERFAVRVRAAFEDSVLDGAVARIAIGPDAYHVEKLVANEWKLDIRPRRFTERRMPAGVAVVATLRDPAAANEPQEETDAEADEPVSIVIDPIGTTTPFEVEFTDAKGRWRVINAGDGTITVARDVGS